MLLLHGDTWQEMLCLGMGACTWGCVRTGYVAMAFEVCYALSRAVAGRWLLVLIRKAF